MTRTALLAAALAAAAPLAAQDAPPPQGVDYRIEARLDETTDVLTGRARLAYTNNARATLDTIYVHQHLNAFRPNSAWARRELTLGERRFQDLGPEEHAFERFTGITVDGAPVTAAYPLAPDSTVAAIPLPDPLAPGGTATLVMDWDARLSTVPRRQGREGRHYDFAQWYPRIAVHDETGWAFHPLMPQGEFYGEFADYDVTLDLAEDQVVGSTGVPVEGDPGWTPTDAERSAYAPRAAEPLGLLAGEPAAGRKRVRWRAEDVHHFAWSVDPEYTHESATRFALDEAGERTDLPPIHVLFRPGDDEWDDGAAARLTYGALSWLQELFGPYPWPQLTNLHRLESGGTEFPMVIMNGGAGEGLIVHETTHQYLHGILANNEWREGWLDEGFTSFVTNWYFEEKGTDPQEVWGRTMEGLAEWDRAGLAAPIATPGAEFPDPRTYGVMTYTRTSAVMRMLRELVGEDVFRRALRTYFDRHRLSHVTGEEFQQVVEEVSGRDLDWFFDQWIRSTARLDYALGDVRTRPIGGGRWRTTAEVIRMGDAWMPVELEVGGVRTRLDQRERVQRVSVVTEGRPESATLDPDRVLIDMDRSNDAREL